MIWVSEATRIKPAGNQFISITSFNQEENYTRISELLFIALNSESNAQAMTTELNQHENAQAKRKGNGIQSIDKTQNHNNGIPFTK